MSREIDIVGAGLAGLVAGINLAGQGFKVKIHETKNTMAIIDDQILPALHWSFLS